MRPYYKMWLKSHFCAHFHHMVCNFKLTRNYAPKFLWCFNEVLDNIFLNFLIFSTPPMWEIGGIHCTKTPIWGGREVPLNTPKSGFLYSVCPLAPTGVVEKKIKIRENVVQNLIKTPQKIVGVTSSKFEDTVHTVKTSR